MAEALACLGVAANVAQIVGLGLQGIMFILDSYKSVDGLVDEQRELLFITENMESQCQALEGASGDPIDNDLAIMVQESRDLANKLQTELRRLNRVSEQHARFVRLRQALRAVLKRSKIKSMEKRLLKMRSQISSTMITSISQSRHSLQAQYSSLNARLDDVNSLLLQRLDSIAHHVDSLSLMGPKAFGDLSGVLATIKSITHDYYLRKHMLEVLNSLHYNQIPERLSDIRPAHGNTFQWALNSSRTTLPEWLERGSGIYWIEGKAGSGKSTLMKFLVRNTKTAGMLQLWANNQPLLIVKHFFWAPGTKLQRDINGLFRALLFQILMEYPSLIQTTCPGRLNPAEFKYLESWTTEELAGCFHKLASATGLPAKFCFFIDGLDEFRGEIEELINVLQDLSRSPNIKLCVSSRPWIEFRVAFDKLPWKLHVHELTQEDIKAYVEERLAESPRYNELVAQSPADANMFQEKIGSRADGVFLWVYLVTRSLLRGLRQNDNIYTLQCRLEEFPDDLEKYFTAMLDSIEPTYWDYTSAILEMLTRYQTSLPITALVAYEAASKSRHKFNRMTNSFEAGLAIDRMIHEYQDFGKSLSEASYRVASTGPEEELSVAEQIATRCKDLVHVYTEIGPGSGSAKVGFLHRTVADFLSLPKTQALIQDRRRDALDPGVALAQAYILLLGAQMINSTGRKRERKSMSPGAKQGYFQRIIHLAFQAKIYAEDAYDDIILFLLAILMVTRNTHLTDSRHAWDVDSIASLVTRLGGVWPPRVKGLSTQARNVFWASYRLTQSQTGFDDEFFFGPEYSGPAWLLTQSIKKALQISLSSSGEPVLEQSDHVNLDHLQRVLQEPHILEALRLSTGESAWLYILQHFQVNYKSGSQVPSNIEDVCRMLISQGAPRYIYIQEDRQEMTNDAYFRKDIISLPFRECGGSMSKTYFDLDYDNYDRSLHTEGTWVIDTLRALQNIERLPSNLADDLKRYFRPNQHLPAKSVELPGRAPSRSLWSSLRLFYGFFS